MAPRDAARAWRPPVPGVRELFHARFHEHAYPGHTHQVWTVLLVESGDVRYALDGRAHGADRVAVTVLPPHVVHDGRAGPTGGFVKRVFYVDDSLLPPDLVGHAVDRPEIDDHGLRGSLLATHRALAAGGDPLHAETALVLAMERLAAHLRGQPPGPVVDPPDLAEAIRAVLDAHVRPGISLAAVAQVVSASRGHVVRAFREAFGIPPHAYLTARRVERARGLLLDGWDAATVAAEVGFHDQAHLTRHFRRHVGTTPGRFARGRW